MLGNSGVLKDGIEAPYFDGSQLCSQTDPDLFFPENTGQSIVHSRIVKKLCSSCHFKNPCLEYAIMRPELQGLWAGTTHRDRFEIRRKRKLK
jgi:WhiB family redox-sensing transcriptional regulator